MLRSDMIPRIPKNCHNPPPGGPAGGSKRIFPAAASFEDAQAELDELVRAMETGQMPLDGLLSAYKRGAQLLEFCRSRLDAVEEQVKVLEEGQLKPWTRP